MNWNLTQPQATLIGGVVGGVLLVVAAIIAFRGQAVLFQRERRRDQDDRVRQSYEDALRFLLSATARTDTAARLIKAGRVDYAVRNHAASVQAFAPFGDSVGMAVQVSLSVSKPIRESLGRALTAATECDSLMASGPTTETAQDWNTRFAASIAEMTSSTRAFQDAAREDLAARMN